MFENKNTDVTVTAEQKQENVDPSTGSYEDKALDIEMKETEVLKELLKKQQKQLFYSRISCIAVVVFSLTVLIVCLKLVPAALKTLDEANTMLVQAEAMLEESETSLDQIDDMTAEITKAAGGINTLVDENGEVLNDTMTKISAIDFDTLNQSISDLQSVIEPMANFMNKFR